MYAIAGMMMGWLSDDMREEPEEIVGRLDRLLEGEFRRAAEKFSAWGAGVLSLESATGDRTGGLPFSRPGDSTPREG